MSLRLALYLLLGLPIAWIDLRSHRIPNRLNAALTLGLIFTSLLGNISITKPARSSLLLASLLLLLYLAIPGSIGAGDIKLALSVGWFSYPISPLLTLTLASCSGLLYGLFLWIATGKRPPSIPFAPFLILAGLFTIWR